MNSMTEFLWCSIVCPRIIFCRFSHFSTRTKHLSYSISGQEVDEDPTNEELTVMTFYNFFLIRFAVQSHMMCVIFLIFSSRLVLSTSDFRMENMSAIYLALRLTKHFFPDYSPCDLTDFREMQGRSCAEEANWYR